MCISRDYIIDEVCPALGIPVVEKNIEQYDVYTADEAFMTGTPFCALPVTSMNGLGIGDGKVGPVFRRLMSCWSEKVGVDVEAQIKAWDKARGDAGTHDAPTPYRFKSK